MPKRIIVAVIAGYATNAILIAAMEPMLFKLVPAGGYLAADVLTQGAIQIGCGYLCSRIANSQRLTATVALIILGLLIGSASVALSWRSERHWYAMALLSIYAPCVWVGYRWERRTRSKIGSAR
jgi:hypothetical protein